MFAKEGAAQGPQAGAGCCCAQGWRPAVQKVQIIVPTAANGREQRPPRPNDLPVFAALDLGTNNCRLLVAVPGRPGSVPGHRRASRASCGWARAWPQAARLGDIGHGPRRRGAEESAATSCATRNITRARMIATEACRAARKWRRVPRAASGARPG